jgi:glutamyl-tRNA reductase
MAVIVLGVSHHGAPLDVRERLAFTPDEKQPPSITTDPKE